MSNTSICLHGDSYELLKDLPDNSIDAIVTDPPYGLGKEPDPIQMLSAWLNTGHMAVKGGGFMGKEWDAFVPQPLLWKEVFRVLKPGGHVLSFFGTRTYDWGVLALRLAGFEIRDQIQWLYGSGFPKSLDVSKAIDKAAGAEREIIGINPSSRPNSKKHNMRGFDNREGALDETAGVQMLTAPGTDDGKQWQGWGTALKPANEPIVLARKPLEKGLTVAENVLKYGTGALAIDACRIGMQAARTYTAPDITGAAFNSDVSKRERKVISVDAQGRWPANVLFDEEAAALLDAQSGVTHTGGNKRKDSGDKSAFGGGALSTQAQFVGDSGGASRFFYCAKASKRERGEGNVHPTVKPIKLMEYLCQLITPPGGIVLDPFMGSGTTGCAAVNLGFDFIGMERDAEYIDIAEKRITAYQKTKEIA